jgi:hypothetical protein
MRIYSSPIVVVLANEKSPAWKGGTGMPQRERFRICEVPRRSALLPHHGLTDAVTPVQVFVAVNAARLLRGDGIARGTSRFLSTERFAAAWIVFRDTPIVRFRSCCAIFVSALPRIS